ncbi:ABC transporter ATP-binding protein [Bifidobacterium bombi]|uniref:Polysaccharide ABC transporter, ATP-binding protein n=1 Tax=Bifidobacterium bombi DSM 19703 TaxID=1341695 RepID=A0A086BPJ2_9BIFI|nr:ABC transporter ATP-binding protein [Bifidobacterium bombi]KFF31856.1 polysaccharide ABC transporter, ATP-binding protein [Bifidobacterium bombi DSM 19703]
MSNNPEIQNKDIVLSVKNVSKSFRLPTEQASGIKQALINWTRGIKGYREQNVLKDISFEVERGDFLGIVGRNGSGKSTLLKLISGIYTPDSGSIAYQGKLVPFIELGVGFNPELTGRENVFLNGAMLGFSRTEIEAMYDDIVSFAELEDFMDQKLKNYSSGMQVRLAFSLAIKAKGDILVLDEVLAVGDEAFQTKCNNFFTEIKKDPSKTVILVTHSMDSVKKYCNKAILIRDGRIVVNGDKNDAANLYTEDNLKSLQTDKHETNENPDKYPLGLNETVPYLKCVPTSEVVLSSQQNFEFDIEYEYTKNEDFDLAFSMLDMTRGGIPYDTGAIPMGRGGSGRHKRHFSLPLNIFNNGTYQITASLRKPDPKNPNETIRIGYTNEENVCSFSISEDAHGSDYALLKYDAVKLTQQ